MLRPLMQRAVAAGIAVLLATASTLTGVPFSPDVRLSAAPTRQTVLIPGGCGGITSGQGGKDGRTYMLCGSLDTGYWGNQLLILGSDGSEQLRQLLPDKFGDVAPSPDGSVIYLSRVVSLSSDEFDFTVMMMTRNADGTYGTLKPVQNAAPAWMIATDDAGNLYVASGDWAIRDGWQRNQIARYTVASGVATRTACIVPTSAATPGTCLKAPDETMRYVVGIGPSPDGSRLLVTNRIDGAYCTTTAKACHPATDYAGVIVFSRDDNGAFKYITKFGYQTEGAEKALYSPYNVAIDNSGNIAATDTSLKQIKFYSLSGSSVTFLGNETVSTETGSPYSCPGTDPVLGDNCYKPHGFAVARDGSVYVAQVGLGFRVPAAKPSVKLTAPTANQSVVPGIQLAADLSGVSPKRVEYRLKMAGNCNSEGPDGNVIETATAAPWTATWQPGNAPPPQVGYCVKARAVKSDANGDWIDSPWTPIWFASSVGHSVALTKPTADSTVVPGTTALTVNLILASASPAFVPIRLDYLWVPRNGKVCDTSKPSTVLVQPTSSPWSANWPLTGGPVSGQTICLKARAVRAMTGADFLDSPWVALTVGVAPDTTRPSVGAVTGAVGSRTLSVAATDAGSGISNVEFRYISGGSRCSWGNMKVIGTDKTSPSPYTIGISLARGTYWVWAQGTDGAGNSDYARLKGNLSCTLVTVDAQGKISSATPKNASAATRHGKVLPGTALADGNHGRPRDDQPSQDHERHHHRRR